jgi:cytochrome c553
MVRVVVILIFLGMTLAVTLAGVAKGESPREVDFDRDIQPILAARCLRCHGANAEAGLSLTNLASATAELASGVRGIVPAHPEQSALVERVTSDDPKVRMPPEGAPLSDDEIGKLKAWIAAGADWPAHWAYRPLTRPEVPRVEIEKCPNWSRNAIDSFILAELQARGLTPSPRADKRTLLRRVYFDLIGLPPSVAATEAFLADESPEAYSRVVDQLLASPQFGERWARHWMDVVHFAETHGQDQDRPREHAWPYRDYLIQSFNADKPFGRFVAEQIAGDALFPADPAAIVATGFLASGPWDESSMRDIREDSLDREIARYLDRDDIVTTVMSTFASSTVHCARCHDHKFDPIAQKDYYALQAVFAATDKGNRKYDLDPQTVVRRQQLTAALAAIPNRIASNDKSLLAEELQLEVAQWEKELAATSTQWQKATVIEQHSDGMTEFGKLEDGSLLAQGSAPDKDVYRIRIATNRRRITGLRLDVLTDDSLPMKGPGRQGNGNLHLSEFRASVIQAGEIETLHPLSLVQPRADFNQAGWEIDKALDGNLVTAWGIYPQVGISHQAVFALDKPLESESPIVLMVELHQVHGTAHTIGRLQLATSESDLVGSPEQNVIPASVVNVIQVPASERTEPQRIALATEYLKFKLEKELASLPAKQTVYCGSNQFETDGSHRPSPMPRMVLVLDRGDIQHPLEEAQPGALNCIAEISGNFQLADASNEAGRRVALARWLADERNVLVWRSIVNRLWHYHFGRGIVDTPNDFGRMGSGPTHPELLDWLATELIARGGSLKAIHRLIVTSEAYQQSSAHNEHNATVDSDNRYLWRMNRQRLDAESIRDAMLSISGKLNPAMGGPSSRQFVQSPGVHVTPVVDYLNFNVDDPANYRRSVYRFIFRTLPDPFMDALDCPDASQLTPKRTESLTALQALAMLNDKLVVRLSEHVAQRVDQLTADPQFKLTQPMKGISPELTRRVEIAYRLILGRLPNANEAKAVTSYVEKHGLASGCRFLMNTNEFMFVD